MIKPWTIEKQETTETGDTWVLYSVIKNTSTANSSYKRLTTTVIVPKGADVDKFMYDTLLEGGWL